ncbi:MAG: 40S ribosomal protein S25 [Desulfurococcales archaeon]|nr:40S ribosomal protein S25 [Desulfurococcales archaeon]
MMAKTIHRNRLGKWLSRILHRARRKSSRTLALLSIKELEARGEKPTLGSIVEEAKKIIEQTRDIVDWGIEKSEYNVSLASAALRELEEMGIIEEYSGVYRVKRSTGVEQEPALTGVPVTASYELILMRR